jgi:hypothetical protein
MYVESLQRLLSDLLPEAAVRDIEAGAPATDAWRGVEEAGFLDLLLSEDEQGPGLELPRSFACSADRPSPCPLQQAGSPAALCPGACAPSGPSQSPWVVLETTVASTALGCLSALWPTMC